MSQNLSAFERFIRFIIGISLLTWAIAGGPIWAYLGFFFLATGSWGTCPIYWLIKNPK